LRGRLVESDVFVALDRVSYTDVRMSGSDPGKVPSEPREADVSVRPPADQDKSVATREADLEKQQQEQQQQ
jgi:hypothetical protein